MLPRLLLASVILLCITACDSKSAFSGEDGIAASAPQPAPANSRIVHADLKSFQCGADACYLKFSTPSNSDMHAICADTDFCTAWSMVNTSEEFGTVNLDKQDTQRVKLTMSSELFEPAGENMDFVRKIEFLQE